MRVREALAAAALRLEGTSTTPRLDAELLMAHALDVTREDVLLRHTDAPAPATVEALVDRRAGGEPVAYITGTRDFWTIRLAVTPAVLIPRPDSETLIEAAVAHFASRAPSRILDLGTGSGALLLAALDQWPDATGLGIDASAEALGAARGNAEQLGFGSRAILRRGDWAAGIDERFDLVLCNPPYVENGADLPHEVVGFEPALALFAGPDGLDCYRVLAPQIARLLAPGGVACVEIGAGQEDTVAAIFGTSGLQARFSRDLGGHNRCLTLTG